MLVTFYIGTFLTSIGDTLLIPIFPHEAVYRGI